MGRDNLGEAKAAQGGFAKDKPLIAAGRTNPRVLIPLGSRFLKDRGWGGISLAMPRWRREASQKISR